MIIKIKSNTYEITESIFNKNKNNLLEKVEGLIERDAYKLINKENKKDKFSREVNCRSLDLRDMLIGNENFEEYKIKSSSLLGKKINEKLIKMYEKELRDNGYFAIASRKNLRLDICFLKRHFLLYSFLNLPWMEAISSIIVLLGTFGLVGIILAVISWLFYIIFIAPIFIKL